MNTRNTCRPMDVTAIIPALFCIVLGNTQLGLTQSASVQTAAPTGTQAPQTVKEPPVKRGAVPDAKQSGGEPDGIVQVANLVYAGTKSSRCFSDNFLIQAEKDSTISTSRRFHAVKLTDDDLFEFPLVIMTGEGDFQLSDKERENFRRYVERGGLLIASAGCSSRDWDRAFRREMAAIFPTRSLATIEPAHPIFHTVYDIETLTTARGGEPKPLVGVSLDGRLGVIYSPDGLNDSHHIPDCCCCGGDELSNAVQVNVNILAYALLY